MRENKSLQDAAQKGDFLEVAKSTLAVESQALALASQRLGPEMEAAAELIFNHKGKVVITGLGKSGLVGQKIAATLCSTGTPAVFLHAAEALHGDLGIYSPSDPTIMISKSGATSELVQLLPTLKELKSPIIAILGNLNSPLAKQVDILLDGSVPQEADPLEIVPTTSTTLAMALGDALASMLISMRNFEKKHFARLHPSGQLGRNLLVSVGDAMHSLKDVPQVEIQASVREVVIAMTERPLGAALVLDKARKLLGIVTDGDIRRCLRQHEDIRGLKVKDIMTVQPTAIPSSLTIGEAIDLMENRPQQISVLPVVDPKTEKVVGLFRIHDAYQPQVI